MKVTKKVLKSLLKCVDEENIRYFLTGLYVDMGKKQITVTDGKILVRMEGVDVADPNTESKNPVIIEYKDVKALLSSMTTNERLRICLNKDETGGVLNGRIAFDAIDGIYPNADVLFKETEERKASGEPGKFSFYDPKLMGKLFDVMNSIVDSEEGYRFFSYYPSKNLLSSLYVEKSFGRLQFDEDGQMQNVEEKVKMLIMPINMSNMCPNGILA